MIKRWGYILGRFIVTSTMQPGGAPLVDRGWTTADADGQTYEGVAILLTPWRRKYGQSVLQRALVLGKRYTEMLVL